MKMMLDCVMNAQRATNILATISGLSLATQAPESADIQTGWRLELRKCNFRDRQQPNTDRHVDDEAQRIAEPVFGVVGTYGWRTTMVAAAHPRMRTITHRGLKTISAKRSTFENPPPMRSTRILPATVNTDTDKRKSFAPEGFFCWFWFDAALLLTR